VSELAVVAPFFHATQGRGPAGFDGLHQAVLMEGQGMSLPVLWAVELKDVGQLQGWRGHQLLARLPLAGLRLAGFHN